MPNLYVSKLRERGFKKFSSADITLNEHMTVLVGDNESGKSTILEALNLALTGRYRGQHISQTLTQDLFNYASLLTYFKGIAAGTNPEAPSVLIEVEFGGTKSELARYNGDRNILHDRKASGIRFHIDMDMEAYADEYAMLVASRNMRALPVELYRFWWESFAREGMRPSVLPQKPVLVDSFSMSNSVASRSFVSMLVRDSLTKDDQTAASLALRNALGTFEDDASVRAINERLMQRKSLTEKVVSIAATQGSRSSWESEIEARLDSIAFSSVGLGQQSIAKVELALSAIDKERVGAILIEEPESHLSHANLNRLLGHINNNCEASQILVTTHSSYVANKLQLSNLLLLGSDGTVSVPSLSADSAVFFQKAAGYNTLRTVLCKAAILVEGDSDELVIQRAYMDRHGGHLPIEDGIEVVSVGTSFKRFIELCDPIGQVLAIVTDNDGDPETLEKRYEGYLDPTKGNVFVSFDRLTLDKGSIDDYSYNTLEPELYEVNGLATINNLLGRSFASRDEALQYMRKHKTDCALTVFSSTQRIRYPKYIIDALTFIETKLGLKASETNE